MHLRTHGHALVYSGEVRPRLVESLVLSVITLRITRTDRTAKIIPSHPEAPMFRMRIGQLDDQSEQMTAKATA